MSPLHSDRMSCDRQVAPELAPLVAGLYAEAPPRERVDLLNGLLRPVGPLALVVIAAGAFAKLLPAGHWHAASATLDDAMRLGASQVLELARYAEQKSPESLLALPERLIGSPLWAGTLSGALLLLALQAWHRRTAEATSLQASDQSPLRSTASV
jgi:predicted Na+-dependent transporter